MALLPMERAAGRARPHVRAPMETSFAWRVGDVRKGHGARTLRIFFALLVATTRCGATLDAPLAKSWLRQRRRKNWLKQSHAEYA